VVSNVHPARIQHALEHWSKCTFSKSRTSPHSIQCTRNSWFWNSDFTSTLLPLRYLWNLVSCQVLRPVVIQRKLDDQKCHIRTLIKIARTCCVDSTFLKKGVCWYLWGTQTETVTLGGVKLLFWSVYWVFLQVSAGLLYYHVCLPSAQPVFCDLYVAHMEIVPLAGPSSSFEASIEHSYQRLAGTSVSVEVVFMGLWCLYTESNGLVCGYLHIYIYMCLYIYIYISL